MTTVGARRHSPARVLAAWADAAGASDGVPPHAAALGLSILTAGDDDVELEWCPPPLAGNPLGFAHGGFVGMALDDAAGLAAAITRARFCPMRTMHLSVDFVRATPLGVHHRVQGKVLHRGRTRVLADARLVDDRGRLMAFASGSFTPDVNALETPVEAE